MKMFLQHLNARPMPPSQRTEMPIPKDLDALVLSCLEKDPALRPQNAAELLRALDRCVSRSPWDQEAARSWWEQHVPELAGPLGIGDLRPSGSVERRTPALVSTSRVTVAALTPPFAFTA
jgi:serine/threonine protein kinase